MRRLGSGPAAEHCAAYRFALLAALLPLALLLAALGPGAGPAAAQSKTCPEINPKYTGPCGPTFVLPGWGDAGGWKDPEQYETIQLADVDGDADVAPGKKELLGRTPAGLAIHWFDKELGQWRPQGDASNVPVVLRAFADPPPLTTANPNPPATDWTLPQYYDTIQAANIDDQPGEEVLARSADGIIVFKFTPGAVRGSGSWQQLSQAGPLAGAAWDAPYYYTTIQTGDLDGDGNDELLARGADGVVVFDWDGKSWTRLPGPSTGILRDQDGYQNPAYYTSIQLGNVVAGQAEELVARNVGGVVLYRYASGSWTQITATHPFTDVHQQSDCPMSSASSACLGDGPAYYSTLQLADINGGGQKELVARASDGLSAYFYSDQQRAFEPIIGRLTALSDAQGADKEQYYSTLQFADINADGSAEALARDKDGLQAWTFDGAKWTKLEATTTLKLADDPWAGDPGDTDGAQRSYYSTIETGDVDGDGHADVVGRGPYGIRTWFYNRRPGGDCKTSCGWDSYLPSGYPDDGLTTEQKAALDKLNALAVAHRLITGAQTTVRDFWRGPNPPTTDQLGGLINNLVEPSFADCRTKTSDVPPQYQTCASAPEGVSVPDWTIVLNKILAEAFWAGLVVGYFDDLKTVKEQLFSEETGQLTKMANDLSVQAAKNNRTEMSPSEYWSSSLGMAGALAGAIPGLGGVIAAAFGVTSELISMLGSGTEKFTDPFQGTFADFQARFANGTADAEVTRTAHSELVRGDRGLLIAVAQLYDRIGSKLDVVGMESAGRQGFALQVYKDLLPTVYVRWLISGCTGDCQSLGGGGALGTSDAFTAIGSQPVPAGIPFKLPWPCSKPGLHVDWVCTYNDGALSNDLATTLWGKVASKCVYQGSAQQQWTFGCNLGLDPNKSTRESSIEHQNWDFLTYVGSPVVVTCVPNSGCTPIGNVRPPPRAASASVVRTKRRGLAVGRRMTVRLGGRVGLPRSVRLASVRVSVPRLLYEPAGAGELVRRSGRSRLILVPRARRGRVWRLYTRRRGRGPRPVMLLRRRARRVLSFDLRVPRARVALPAACSGTRPGVDLATGTITLRTRLRIADGRRRPVAITLSTRWRCRRNRLGAVRWLVHRRPYMRNPRRRALAVAVRGPRRPHAGEPVAYRIRVRNRRPTHAYGVMVRAFFPRAFRLLRARGARRGTRHVVWRLERLGRGRSRTFVLRLRAPRRATATRGELVVGVHALDTRAASRVVRTRVRP